MRHLLLLALLASAPAWADEEKKDEPGQVVVNGMRSPELKNYRIMHAGVLAFEDNHALAPQAPQVRFKLRARKSAGPAPYEGLTLRLVGDDTSMTVPFDANGVFDLPPQNKVADEDALLVLNKHKGGYNWMPVVRSAGVPEGMLRMGDLRLECQVLVATAKKEIGFLTTVMVNTFMLTSDWCSFQKYEFNFPSFAERPLASATLVDGDKRVALKIDKDATVFFAPLPDKKISNDALIELVYADTM